MAQAPRVASLEDLKKHFKDVVDTLDNPGKTPGKLFPNGIELLEVTLKAGNNIEFSVVISGKEKKSGGATA